MKTWMDHALLGLHVLGALLLIAMAAVILYDVGGRLLFNRPFPGTAELVAVGLVLQTYLQTPYVIRHQQLLRVSFLADRLPGPIGSRLQAMAYLGGAAFLIAIAMTSWDPAISSLAQGEFFGNDAFRIPASPLRFGAMMLWIIGGLVCLGLVADGLKGRLSSSNQSQGKEVRDNAV